MNADQDDQRKSYGNPRFGFAELIAVSALNLSAAGSPNSF
jgi:hypothetical protein